MMALFGFGKKKEGATKPSCACSCGCSAPQVDATTPTQSCCQRQGEWTIKVLGTGCASCHKLLEHTQAAVSQMGLDAQVEYVQDMAQIPGYGVMSLPALVVNDQVVSTGKVLKPAEVETMLRNLGC